jgi:hypothetical protein
MKGRKALKKITVVPEMLAFATIYWKRMTQARRILGLSLLNSGEICVRFFKAEPSHVCTNCKHRRLLEVDALARTAA